MKMKSVVLACLLASFVFAFLPASPAAGADTVIWPAASTRVQGLDEARISRPADAGAVKVAAPASKRWPGLQLLPPTERAGWDLSASARLVVEVRNTGKEGLSVHVRVDNPGADGKNHCLNGTARISAGKTAPVQVELKRGQGPRPEKPLFGMRGYPDVGGIDTAKVTGVLVFLDKPSKEQAWEVLSVKAIGQAAPAPPAGPAGRFLPFIDAFGQYKHRDWPGKIKDLDDLARRRQAEADDLARSPGAGDWNRWGGWQGGPLLKATGFFRTEKHKGKWWLVDPEGRLFWSHGIDCVMAPESTPLDDREDWFEGLPAKGGDLGRFYGSGWVLHGHYAGKTVRTFDFWSANLRRKYGPEWEKAGNELAHRRLRSWGMNTIANWSTRSVVAGRKTPYTATINFKSRLLEGSSGYWGKFRDVFDPSFEQAVTQRMTQEAGQSAGDPWCLGYFVDNEIAWGNETSLAEAALKSPGDQPAKKAFLDDLKAKYQDIARLNEAWAASYASWQALQDDTRGVNPAKARADLQAFYTRSADRYFSVIRAAVKKTAPNQLYLGCRFAWGNPLAAQSAARHCDVVSYNLYRRSVADFQFPGPADVPLIIGEFHFGALDRGLFHTGLVACKDQQDRAAAYREYVLGCLRHGGFVGCHWFKYHDEPTTGRSLDEENYQIGFLDIADTPYPETVRASREVGYRMYQTRLGE